MIASELFYYTGTIFFVLLILATLIVSIWVITFLISLRKVVKSFQRLASEAGTGIKIKILETFLKFLGR